MYGNYDFWTERGFEVEEIAPLIDGGIINITIKFIEENRDLVSGYDYVDLLSGILEYYEIYGKLSEKQRLSISLFIYEMDDLYDQVEEYIEKQMEKRYM